MEELIVEYINSLCEVKGGVTVFFDGEQVYYDVLKKHIGDLFDLEEYSVDGYLICCLSDMDGYFSYNHFMSYNKPLLPEGKLYYMDYQCHNRDIAREMLRASGIQRSYFGGVDPALGDDVNIDIARQYAGLYHQNQRDDAILAMSRAVAAQSFNLDLTQFDRDLPE